MAGITRWAASTNAAWAIGCLCTVGTVARAVVAVCPSCDGAGTGPFQCSFCKGTGKDSSGFKCSLCNGKGFQKCSSCNGTGQKK